ncbi:Hypothetical predicted protein [Olea europaea subsp. europaea]|uniref:Uncharacterized protein n=1 Tax=Olea europaea subsp. europaea TaxID=158383 RepID=A0A8S0U0E3_OLEEU|nr:Hypothetical predicted protein [Olea europaea subsp. europaea]
MVVRRCWRSDEVVSDFWFWIRVLDQWLSVWLVVGGCDGFGCVVWCGVVVMAIDDGFCCVVQCSGLGGKLEM